MSLLSYFVKEKLRNVKRKMKKEIIRSPLKSGADTKSASAPK